MANKKENVKKTSTRKVKTNKEEKIKENTTPINEKELEIANGDPSVIQPIEESNEVFEAVGEAIANTIEEIVEAPVEAVKEIVEEAKKVENKTTRFVGNIFGYSWNGQEMDY